MNTTSGTVENGNKAQTLIPRVAARKFADGTVQTKVAAKLGCVAAGKTQWRKANARIAATFIADNS